MRSNKFIICFGWIIFKYTQNWENVAIWDKIYSTCVARHSSARGYVCLGAAAHRTLKLLTVVVFRLDRPRAVAQCQCQQQQGTRASREAHPRSKLSSRAAGTYEPRRRSHPARTATNYRRAQPTTTVGAKVHGRRVNARWTRTWNSRGRQTRQTAPRAVLRATDRRRSARFYARTASMVGQRACAPLSLEGCGWMGVERISTYYADTHRSLLRRVNERKDTGCFYERVAAPGCVREASSRRVHNIRAAFSTCITEFWSASLVKWNRRAVPRDCLGLLRPPEGLDTRTAPFIVLFSYASALTLLRGRIFGARAAFIFVERFRCMALW